MPQRSKMIGATSLANVTGRSWPNARGPRGAAPAAHTTTPAASPNASNRPNSLGILVVHSGVAVGDDLNPKPDALILRERVVRKAVQPALAGLSRGNHRVLGRVRVLARVAIRRVVAAKSGTALLAC